MAGTGDDYFFIRKYPSSKYRLFVTDLFRLYQIKTFLQRLVTNYPMMQNLINILLGM